MKVYHGKNNRGGGIRDYNKRRYGNPLFKNKVRKRKNVRDFGQVRRWTFTVIVLIASVVGLWYLFWSPSFQITDIVIEGADVDTEIILRESLTDRLEMRRFLLFPQSAIFLYDTGEAENDIRSKFYLDNLEVRKKLPNTVTVMVQERTAVAALLSDGEFFALDESGFVIRDLTKRERIAMDDLPEGMGSVDSGELGAESVDVAEIEGGGDEPDPGEARRNSNPMPLVLDRERADGQYAPGDNAISAEVLILILQTQARLPDITGSGVRWYALESAKDTVDVVLREGWHVYLTTMIPFDTQGERLGLVMKEKIGERRPELEYIDLRYDERIFFRFADEAE